MSGGKSEHGLQEQKGHSNMVQYMVIEKFKDGCVNAVYDRFLEKGRMLPEGLLYLSSWVNREIGVCYQLMATDNRDLFDVWTSHWSDLTDFEIIPLDP